MLSALGFDRGRRLLTPADYSRVFKKAKRVSDGNFTILARRRLKSAKTEEQLSARLGLAIAKKNIRKAVQRNRIKRQVRESFRHHAQALVGLDLVVMAKRGADLQPNDRLATSLAWLWSDLIKRL
ncbi:MAG: ribonuclease P protein component [Gammaproteobacteria bacterium]